MAQTKRKRQTKHRGNAAGIVEARGRTGRSSADAAKGKGKGKDIPRADRPPSWRSAFTRAMIASVALLLIGLLFIKGSAGGSLPFLFPLILAIYTLIGYYTDKFLFDRRQRKKAAGKIAT